MEVSSDSVLLDFRSAPAPLATRGGLGDSPVEFKSLAGTGDTVRAETRQGDGDGDGDEKISSSGSVEVFVSLEGYSGSAAVRTAWRSSNPNIPATEKLLN